MYGWERVYCDENCGEKITEGIALMSGTLFVVVDVVVDCNTYCVLSLPITLMYISLCTDFFLVGVIELCDDRAIWRKEDNVENRVKVYNVAASFLALATFCAITVTIGFTLNLCGFMDERGYRSFYGSIGIIGLFALLFTIIYFPIQHPKAWSRDNECWPNIPGFSGACDSFIGHDKASIGSVKVETWWGGAGM